MEYYRSSWWLWTMMLLKKTRGVLPRVDKSEYKNHIDPLFEMVEMIGIVQMVQRSTLEKES
jgi:hypothetical protein